MRKPFLLLLVLSSFFGKIFAVYAQDTTWTLRGTVFDSVNKKPIAGATVYLDRDPPQLRPAWQDQDKDGREISTDSDGGFTLDGLSEQNHLLYVAKAGYISATGSSTGAAIYSSNVVQHWHAESTFLLTPAATVAGRVTAESGAGMRDVLMTLYSGLVQDGRMVWQHAQVVATDASGHYRFTDLRAGTYVVVSDWIFDNDPAPVQGTNCSSTQKFMPQAGYPPAANPGVLDFSKAEPVSVKTGKTENVDLRLQHRVFHSVTWEHETRHQAGFDQMRDSNGRVPQRAVLPAARCGRKMPVDFQPIYVKPYRQFQNAGAVRETINLPDGAYTHRVRAGFSKDEGPGKYMSLWLGSFGEFTVAGKPLMLTYPEKQPLPEPAVQIHVHVEFGPDRTLCTGLKTTAFSKSESDDGEPSWHTLWLSRADPLPEVGQPIAMDESRENKPEFYYLEAGRYWVHGVEPGNTGSFADLTNTYIASITAGGVDMAEHPLEVGLDGTAPALEVTLHNDCGILNLKYAPTQTDETGEPPTFYGLLVPQFSAFENVHSFSFEVGRQQEVSIGDLAPGHYKFYVSPRDRGVPFREPEHISPGLGPGQDLWLKPREPVSISVSEPAQQ
jgi:hypothetical protein